MDSPPVARHLQEPRLDHRHERRDQEEDPQEVPEVVHDSSLPLTRPGAVAPPWSPAPSVKRRLAAEKSRTSTVSLSFRSRHMIQSSPASWPRTPKWRDAQAVPKRDDGNQEIPSEKQGVPRVGPIHRTGTGVGCGASSPQWGMVSLLPSV